MLKELYRKFLIVVIVFFTVITFIILLATIVQSRENMIADMQKDPEKYMTQEQIMFIRINDINKKLDVLIEKVGADKK
jgi:hypothetical protein